MPMSPRLLRPRAAGGFDPRKIAGLNFWLDFSDISTLGPTGSGVGSVSLAGEIGYVRDKGPSGIAFTQGTGALRPVLGQINGLYACDWGTGAHDKRLISNTGSRNPREITAVIQWDAGGSAFQNFETVAGSTGNGPLIQAAGSSASWGVLAGGSTNEVKFVNNSQTSVAFPPLGSGLPAVVQAFVLSNLSQTPQLGTDRGLGLSRGWKGKIAEIVAYDRELTAAERESIRRGLARKWGVQF
jgi:hypothetical protein